MKFQESIYKNIVRISRNADFKDIFDVELMHIDRLKAFDSVECHIILYPYSRKITSRNFEFNPFEEYVNDILSHQKSAYTKINNSFSNIFGLFLGLLITLIFLIYKSSELLSIESIVSVFGAYFVGKEMWTDIEKWLIDISRGWKIRYLERYYFYRLEKNTTLSIYSHLAKKRRYGKAALMPEKMDFIQKSNSQTMRMFFNMKDLKDCSEASAHVLSIHLDSELLEDFKEDGYLLGVKLSFNKRFMGIRRCREFFQSIDKDVAGCLDENCQWVNNGVFYRNTFTMGRLKWFMSKGLLRDKRLFGPMEQ